MKMAIQSTGGFAAQAALADTQKTLAKAATHAAETTPTKAAESADETDPESVVLSWTPAAIRFKTSEELLQESQNEIRKYVQEPLEKANAALTSAETELKNIRRFVAAAKPGIDDEAWDFTLKDGKLEVSGSGLSDKDKAWLEKVLNGNKTLVGAATQYYEAVVTYYENAPDHTSSFSFGFDRPKYYSDVAKQIDGELPLRAMMKNPYTTADGEVTCWSEVTPYFYAMDNAGKYLASTETAKYMFNNVKEVIVGSMD